jgi:hypothetical protein
MHLRSIAAPGFVAAALPAAACRRAPSPAPEAPQGRPAERTVFTDSLLHAELCERVKPGEDWRRVCVPLDQSLQRQRPARPPRR